MYTNAEKLVKFAPVRAEIFGGICQVCRLIQKGAVVTLAISGVTGPILIIFAHDVSLATILALNIFELELPYSYPSQNATCRMKVILPILPKIGCHCNVP